MKRLDLLPIRFNTVYPTPASTFESLFGKDPAFVVQAVSPELALLHLYLRRRSGWRWRVLYFSNIAPDIDPELCLVVEADITTETEQEGHLVGLLIPGLDRDWDMVLNDGSCDHLALCLWSKRDRANFNKAYASGLGKGGES